MNNKLIKDFAPHWIADELEYILKRNWHIKFGEKDDGYEFWIRFMIGGKGFESERIWKPIEWFNDEPKMILESIHYELEFAWGTIERKIEKEFNKTYEQQNPYE